MAWIAVEWREDVEAKTVISGTTATIYRRRVVVTEYEQASVYALNNVQPPSQNVTSVYGNENSTMVTFYKAVRNPITLKTVERKVEVNPGQWKKGDQYTIADAEAPAP